MPGVAAWPDALEPMITLSDNDATDTCVALLHRCGVVDTLNQRFAALGLPTLQLHNTRPTAAGATPMARAWARST
jgi:beta-lactamase class A